MSMGGGNLLGLIFHGLFYTGFIFQYQKQWVNEGILGLYIPVIGRMRMIWYKLFLKLRVPIDVLCWGKLWINCINGYHQYLTHEVVTNTVTLEEIIKIVQWHKINIIEIVMYVLQRLQGIFVHTQNFIGQYYTWLEVTGQCQLCPLWPYNIMVVLGAVPPVFLMNLWSYDHTRYSNTRSRNDYTILWYYKVSTETNIRSRNRTRLVLRYIVRIMCLVMILGCREA